MYKRKHRSPAERKFSDSLLVSSDNALFKIRFSVLPRGHTTEGIAKKPIERLNLLDADTSVVFVGENRCGKTVYLSSVIRNELFPWWSRLLFPPRGLFLAGHRDSPSVKHWLRDQLSITEDEHPWYVLTELLSQRYQEQRARLFLVQLFKTALPAFLLPRPSIVVVDQAEELLRAHRAEFLVEFYNLVKAARDQDLFRLVLVVNSENAVKALELMNAGNMFSVVHAPKVARAAVVDEYGEEVAKIFDDCDGCIGVALDYLSDTKRPNKDMPAKEYALRRKNEYLRNHCLTDEITREEYHKAGEHFRK